MNINRFASSVVVVAFLAACAAPKPKPVPPPPVAPPPATQASAAPAPAPAPEIPTSPTGKLQKIYGVVVSIDADAHKITIKDKRGVSRTFVIASDAKLTKGGDDAAIAFSDIKANDHVRLRCGQDIAASVHVKVASGSSTAAVATNK